MIPDAWYAVLESREVPRKRPVAVTRLGERLVFWREGDRVVCLADACAHRKASLGGGKVVDGCVECPFHGFRYDATGRCRLIPARGRSAEVEDRFRVRMHPARVAHGFVWVWWGKEPETLPDIPFFGDIDGSFRWSSMRSRWKVHYSRAIENQLDVMHVPFVHHNTIGRGGRTLVDGPIVEWKGERKLVVHVFLRSDDGSAPIPAGDLDPARASVRLELLLPNVWQNVLSDRMRVVAAFAPVDEENTVIYLRFYQRIVTVPILCHLFNRAMMRFNRVVLEQDRRVVETQRPVRTELRMGEMLVQGDRPIAEYRMRRDALKGGVG